MRELRAVSMRLGHGRHAVMPPARVSAGRRGRGGAARFVFSEYQMVMIKKIRDITLQMAAGANVATAAAMLVVGYSDRINPVEHSFWANAGLAFPVFVFVNVCFLVFFLVVRKRYALVSLAGFLLCYPPMRKYCPFNITRDAPEGALKVLSYNVFSFNTGAVPEGSPNPIIEYIVNSGADIVCLQEAQLNKDIEEAVGGVYEYRDSVLHSGGGDCLVLLSKYPIISKEHIRYESKGNLSAAFKVKVGADVITVVNNHFESSGLSLADRAGFKQMVKGETGQDTMRMESKRLLVKLGESVRIRAPQVEAVAEYVRRCKGGVILCGDFNDSPISYTHRTLDKVLTDCYVATGNGPGISYHHNAIFVRIDNIMCSDFFRPYGCKVDRSIGFSDHYPIYCWLEKAGANG